MRSGCLQRGAEPMDHGAFRDRGSVQGRHKSRPVERPPLTQGPHFHQQPEILKKGDGISGELKAVMLKFIAGRRSAVPVGRMSRVMERGLRGLSTFCQPTTTV